MIGLDWVEASGSSTSVGNGYSKNDVMLPKHPNFAEIFYQEEYRYLVESRLGACIC